MIKFILKRMNKKFIKKIVKPVKIVAICECGGEFKDTGICLTSCPCKYPHICNKCGRPEIFDSQYPKIVFEDEVIQCKNT